MPDISRMSQSLRLQSDRHAYLQSTSVQMRDEVSAGILHPPGPMLREYVYSVCFGKTTGRHDERSEATR